MTAMDWNRYYTLTGDKPPHPLLARAVALAPAGGRALDLGAGAGRGTLYLLQHGFEVTAVDAEPSAQALLLALPQQASVAQSRLQVVHARFEDFSFATYDLVSAQFALPFIPRNHFADVFARIKASLVPSGIFAGQLFGVNDQWNTPDRDMTFLRRAEAEDLLTGLDIVEFTEEDADGTIADGSPKHWHVFHVLARKPA